LVDDGVIDLAKSRNDVFKEEDSKSPTHDDIFFIILLLNDTGRVLCTSPKIYILLA
jgi:hypothetical protein